MKPTCYLLSNLCRSQCVLVNRLTVIRKILEISFLPAFITRYTILILSRQNVATKLILFTQCTTPGQRQPNKENILLMCSVHAGLRVRPILYVSVSGSESLSGSASTRFYCGRPIPIWTLRLTVNVILLIIYSVV